VEEEQEVTIVVVVEMWLYLVQILFFQQLHLQVEDMVQVVEDLM
jgi:hypothetical protein